MNVKNVIKSNHKDEMNISMTHNSGLYHHGVELCADVIVSAAVARRSISVGGGGGAAPVQKSRRRRRRGAGPEKSAAAARRGVGGQKHFFLRFTKKFHSILKIFLGTFLVIKALRFADDQC